jgi:hypothetical protein
VILLINILTGLIVNISSVLFRSLIQTHVFENLNLVSAASVLVFFSCFWAVRKNMSCYCLLQILLSLKILFFQHYFLVLLNIDMSSFLRNNIKLSDVEWLNLMSYCITWLTTILCILIWNFVAWVRERPMPTERPPLVGEVSANFYG